MDKYCRSDSLKCCEMISGIYKPLYINARRCNITLFNFFVLCSSTVLPRHLLHEVEELFLHIRLQGVFDRRLHESAFGAHVMPAALEIDGVDVLALFGDSADGIVQLDFPAGADLP